MSCLQSLFNISRHPGARTSWLVELINNCAYIGEVQVAICQIPRSVHAGAFAISRWTTSVVDRQACLAGRLETENVACRRRYTTR
jgi:hypothetical protein